MKRSIGRSVIFNAAAAVLLLCAAAIAVWKLAESRADDPAADEPASFVLFTEGFTERKIVDQASALAAVGDVADVLGIENVDTEFSECRKNTLSGNTYYRFYQEYKGIPVYGRSVVVSADADGNSLALSGNYLSTGNPDVEPKVDITSAIQTVRSSCGADATVSSNGLVIYSLSEHRPELAWKIYAASDQTVEYCFVSAESGEILGSQSFIFAEQAECSGADLDGNNQSFLAEFNDGVYVLEDARRDITIYNANHSTLKKEFAVMDSNRQVYYTDGDHWVDQNGNIVRIDGDNYAFVIHDGDGNVVGTDGEFVVYMKTANIFTKLEPVTSISAAWENAKAVTLMSRLASTYDFWSEKLGRQSFDGAFGSVIAVYDDFMNTGWFVGDTENAYSWGLQGVPITVLSFGTDNSLSTDVIAHEYTHSVERSISGMVYQGESGALMEAYSDVFGEIAEDWGNDGLLNGNCDWIHNGSRNMISPAQSKSACPDTYQGSAWKDAGDTDNDFGGVHTNNTVISHAVYLMSTGIGGNPAFQALSTEDLAHLLYETLYTLPADCTFGAFRSLAQNMAEIMYRQGRLTYEQARCVSNAFFQVGIGAAAVPAARTLTLDVYDVDGQPYDNYTLYIRSGGSEKTCDGKTACTEGITFPHSGQYELCVVDKVDSENQTSVLVQVVEHGGVRKLPVYTRCGVTKLDGPIESVQPDFTAQQAELIAHYGVFESSQSGIMHSWDAPWFRGSGILSADLLDFDADGTDEMLICAAEPCDRNTDGSSHIMLYMYDSEDGAVVQADAAVLGAYVQADYVQSEQAEILLHANYWTEEMIAVYAVKISGKCYIVCEKHSLNSAFADGSDQAYWVLEYADGAFRYVCSFTQTDGGSSDFSYTGYGFENGVCVKSDLYYSDWPENAPLYTNFGQAITAFFDGYEIRLNSALTGSEGYDYFQSVFSPENDMSLIFSLTNRITEADWMNSTYGFSAAVSRGNDLPDTGSGTQQSPGAEVQDNEQPPELRKAYQAVLRQHPETVRHSYGDGKAIEYATEYMLYDIDKDGFDELIVKEDMTGYSIYTFDGANAAACGEYFWFYNNCLYAYDGNGLVVHDGGMGSLHLEDISLYTLAGGMLEWSETIMSTESCSYDELAESLRKYTPLDDFRPISEYAG